MNKNYKDMYEYCKKDTELTYDFCYFIFNNYLYAFEAQHYPIWIKTLFAHVRLRIGSK